MKLTTFKTRTCHYSYDQNRRRQGIRKVWDENGKKKSIGYFRDDKKHGEHRHWYSTSWSSNLYVDGEFVCDAKNLSKEEKLLLSIKYNVQFVKRNLRNKKHVKD